MKHTVTIRMGAPYWDATVRTAQGSAHFDLRKLWQEKKLGPWYGAFMGSVRQMYGGKR